MERKRLAQSRPPTLLLLLLLLFLTPLPHRFRNAPLARMRSVGGDVAE
jgi:hypothetical protein